MNFLKKIVLLISIFIATNSAFSQCFQIESILVDACDNGSDEGLNEMFRIKIGATPLNTSNFSVNWPAQSWLGLTQNATTAAKVAQLNANILAAGGCGEILEPVGGVLPANATVLVVTSYNLDIDLNSFNNLTSTLYMIFQNNATRAGGHFANYNDTAGTRTLKVNFGASCSDTVSYQRTNLVNIFGLSGGTDPEKNGATVNFTPSGTPSYVNNGCTAPIPPFSVEAGTTPVAVCAGQTINLSGTAQGQTSVSWTAPDGSFSNPNNLATNYTVPTTAVSGSTITLTLTATNACGVAISDTILLNVGGSTINLTSAAGTDNQTICAGENMATIEYQLGGGATGATVLGLPTGVISTYYTTGNRVTITGTPGATFNYSIATNGGCGNTMLTGSVTVSSAATLALTSATGTANQTVCTGNALIPIAYTFGGGATGATVTGLPGGINAITLGNVVTISGTPTEDFTYTITTYGVCQATSLNGTATLGTPANLNLFCDSANSTPTALAFDFSNVGQTNFTYSYTIDGGAPITGTHTAPSNYTVSGLTAGQTVVFTLTANGLACPTSQTVTCTTACSNGTLVLTSLPATSNQTVCTGAALLPIQYTFGGGATSATVTGLPAGITAATNGNIVTISGTPTANFTYTLTTVGGCTPVVLTGTVAVANGIVPVFTQQAPVCTGTAVNLPTTSTNGITGSWQQTALTTTNATYEFTPDAGQCAVTTTMIVALNPIPVVTATPASESFCSGGTTAIQLSSTVPGAQFSWTASAANSTGFAASNGGSSTINQTLTLNAGVTEADEITYTITATANGCVSEPIVVVVTITPSPDVIITPDDITICNGATTDIPLTSSVTGVAFDWTIISSSGVTGASNGNGTNISQTLTVAGLAAGTVVYEVTPRLNGCAGVPKTVTVRVNPTPESFPTATHPEICTHSATNISIPTFNPNTLFDWTVEAVGVTGASDSAASVSVLLIQQTLTTTSDERGYVDYTITPRLDNCIGVPIVIRVYVNPLPKPILNNGSICVDANGVVFQNYTLDTGLDNSLHNFIWYFEGVAIPNATQATYTANAVGTYSVIATHTLTNCASEMVSAVVNETLPATSFTYTQSTYFSDNATLTVAVLGGNGTLQYQLDEGPFQYEPIFNNVSPGPHLITVIDTQGCTFFTQTVFVIDYPKYFTPNQDGIQDTWHIAGLENQLQAEIFIFDRQGKLIKQLAPAGEGWDGTYNGAQLPSTDYWFTVDYIENGAAKQFKAHFSLIR